MKRSIKIKSVEKPLSTPHKKNEKPLALTCIGMSLIFMLAIVMSGCVVHHKGHGYGHGKGHGRGHHKGHIKIKPHVGVSVSPLIVIDD